MALLESAAKAGEKVAQVLALKRGYSPRSDNDCSALVTTNCQKNSGLWIIDELHIAEDCGSDLLVTALEILGMTDGFS